MKHSDMPNEKIVFTTNRQNGRQKDYTLKPNQ